MNTKRKIQLTIGSITLAVIVFFAGVQVGQIQNDDPDISLPTNNATLKDDFSLFWETVGIVKDDYYKPEDIQDDKLLYGAVKGMVGSLDDPYSTFFEPSDAKKFAEDVSGSFGGIGAEIGMRDDQLVIVSPLKGNPAEDVGLKSGDKILKVDETFTDNLSIEEAVKIIRGEEGTIVNLLILREGWTEPKEFAVTRGNIEVPTLDWEMKEGNIAHVQLYSFNANAPEEFYRASLEALVRGAQGIVLDLRNNSGGYLEVALNISGWFLDKGDVVVKEKFPGEKTELLRSSGNGAWKNLPVVVLVNEGSASASEIVAGALRDHIGAPLVGKTTFGKGTVQQIETLPDGSKIKISVAEWITPNDAQINEKGLAPDYEVEFTEENVENEEDPQLEKALEIIREKTENRNTIKTLIL